MTPTADVARGHLSSPASHLRPGCPPSMRHLHRIDDTMTQGACSILMPMRSCGLRKDGAGCCVCPCSGLPPLPTRSPGMPCGLTAIGRPCNGMHNFMRPCRHVAPTPSHSPPCRAQWRRNQFPALPAPWRTCRHVDHSNEMQAPPQQAACGHIDLCRPAAAAAAAAAAQPQLTSAALGQSAQ